MVSTVLPPTVGSRNTAWPWSSSAQTGSAVLGHRACMRALSKEGWYQRSKPSWYGRMMKATKPSGRSETWTCQAAGAWAARSPSRRSAAGDLSADARHGIRRETLSSRKSRIRMRANNQHHAWSVNQTGPGTPYACCLIARIERGILAGRQLRSRQHRETAW